MRKRVKSIIWMAVAAMAITLTPAYACAGSINGNEQSVIDAASGTFEYEGENYQASQKYLDALKAKFSEDDMDLSAEDANKAIAEIYSNVETGVKEGYLEKKSEETTGSSSSNGGTTSFGDTTDNQTGNNTNGGDTSTGDSSGSSSASGDAQSDRDENDDSQMSNGSDTDSEVQVPSKGKFYIDLKKVVKQVSIMEQSSGETVQKKIEKNFVEQIRMIIFGLVVVLTILLLIALVIRKGGKWKKIWPSAISIVLLSFGIALGATAAITEFGLCSGRVLVSQVSSEGYYKNVYKDFHKNECAILKSAGFPEGILDDLLDERSVYLDGKLALEAKFNSGRTKQFMNIQDEVKDILMNYLQQENYSNIDEQSDMIGNIAGLIQNQYVDSLKFSYADTMRENKESQQKTCNIMIGVALFMCFLGLLLAVLSQHYIHRLFRLVGWSCAVPGVATIAAAITYLITKKYENLGLVQSFYSEFFSEYLKWNAELLIAVAALEFVVVSICAGVTLTLRKTHKRNPFRKIK